MRRDKMFQKNLTLSTEFNKYLLEHPQICEQLPQDAHLIFLPDDDEKLKQANQQLAHRLRKKGELVVYIKIRRLPKINTIPLFSPKIEVMA